MKAISWKNGKQMHITDLDTAKNNSNSMRHNRVNPQVNGIKDDLLIVEFIAETDYAASFQ